MKSHSWFLIIKKLKLLVTNQLKGSKLHKTNKYGLEKPFGKIFWSQHLASIVVSVFMEILLPTLPHDYWDGLMNSPKAWSIDTLPFGECCRMMPDSCLEQWWGQLLCVSLHTQRIWSTISGAMRHSQQDLFKMSPREPQGKVRIFQQWECMWQAMLWVGKIFTGFITGIVMVVEGKHRNLWRAF